MFEHIFLGALSIFYQSLITKIEIRMMITTHAYTLNTYLFSLVFGQIKQFDDQQLFNPLPKNGRSVVSTSFDEIPWQFNGERLVGHSHDGINCSQVLISRSYYIKKIKLIARNPKLYLPVSLP
jgi:hypothetical protein